MRIVPALNGWIWLKLGWMLFRKSPAAWIMLVLLLTLATGLINLVPFAGPALATALIPGISMSFMIACADAEHGAVLRPALLVAGFRLAGTALVTLGGMYLAGMLAALGASSLADGGALMRWMLSGVTPPDAAILDGSLAGALGLTALVATPVLMAFWFSPMLVGWQRMGPAQAMFYSFFASLRNWRALTVYGAAIAFIAFALSLGLAALVPLVKNGPLLRAILTMLNIVLLPALFASFYYSYRDIFPDEPAEEQPGAQPAS